MKDTHDLFINELKTIYSAEKQIVKALPKIIEGATSPKLREAFQHHLAETKEQVRRLETIAKELKIKYGRTSNPVMKALLKDTDKVLKANYLDTVKDAALINCAQHIEHYEIASYGLLKTFAKHFHYANILDLLEATSKEEGHANKVLTEIAEGSFFSTGVNAEAIRRHAA